VAAAIAPCLGIVYLSATRLERAVLERTLQACRYVAASLSSQEKILLSAAAQAMAGTALAPPIRDGNPAEAAVILRPFGAVNPYFRAMRLCTERGEPIAASGVVPAGARSGAAVGRGEGFALGRAESRLGMPSFTASMPVRGPRGEPAGYLEAWLDVVASLDASVLAEIPDGAVVEIADRDGRSLYRSDRPSSWGGFMDATLADMARGGAPRQVFSIKLSDGTEALASTAGVDGDGDTRADLLVSVSLGRDRALAQLRGIMRDAYASIALVAVASLSISLILFQVSILRDVRGIVARASGFGGAGGDGGPRPPSRSVDELRELSETLDRVGELIIDRESALRLRQEELLSARGERNALLREVHHRVYNNLQVVLSLLRLEEGAAEGRDPLSVLRDIRRRIVSMSLAHATLYGAEDLDRVEFGAYAKAIMNGLLDDYPELRRRVALATEIETIDLDISQAIPLGLILTELFVNCLVHAFPDRRSGVVTVGLVRAAEGRAAFSVTDDGIGFSEPWSDDGRLGLMLAESMAAQLNGRLRLDEPARGARVVVEFPLAPRGRGDRS
jgi:two-component sensor histidine kinase